MGFRCKVKTQQDGALRYCNRVVRTERGIAMHCKRVHKIVTQMELFDAEETQREANELQPVRANVIKRRSRDGDAGIFREFTDEEFKY